MVTTFFRGLCIPLYLTGPIKNAYSRNLHYLLIEKHLNAPVKINLDVLKTGLNQGHFQPNKLH